MQKRPVPPPSKNKIVVLKERVQKIVLEEKSFFPVVVNVSGVSMGDNYCVRCEKQLPRGNNCCFLCGSTLVCFRQHLLKTFKQSGNDIIDLKKEENNCFDPFAVAVYPRFGNGTHHCVGYIPKKHASFNSEIASRFLSNGKLYATGKVVGGDLVETETGGKGLFGLRLEITDVPI